jgi:putative DNA primase/helicase
MNRVHFNVSILLDLSHEQNVSTASPDIVHVTAQPAEDVEAAHQNVQIPLPLLSPSAPAQDENGITLPRLPLPARADGRTPVLVEPGRAHVTMTMVAHTLANAEAGLFKSNDAIVNVTHQGDKARIEPISKSALLRLINKHVAFFKTTSKGHSAIDPPPAVVNSLLKDTSWWEIPVLTGLRLVPPLLPEGRLVQSFGFDQATGIYYVPGPGLENLAVPDTPTREDAVAALAVLKELLADFCWGCPAAKYAAVAAILTAVLRPDIAGPVPLFAINGPQAGVGKSILATMVAIIATGQAGPVMEQGSDEEFSKRLTAFALDGVTFVIMDNVVKTLGGASLLSVLTAEQRIGRKLGTSKHILDTVRLTLLATGNNLDLAEDAERRTLRIDLASASDNPADRADFAHADIHAWTLSNRAMLVGAALTIAKAYAVAGKPAVSLSPFGSYSAWSEAVRSPIVWAGGVDPCEVRHVAAAMSPEKEAWHRLLTIAVAFFGNSEFGAADLAIVAYDPSHAAPEIGQALHEALALLADSTAVKVPVLRINQVLRSHNNSVRANLRLERSAATPYSTAWKIVPVGNIDQTMVA